MATITLKGNEIHTYGELPIVGSSVPNFSLVNNDLGTVTMADMKGSRVILNIFFGSAIFRDMIDIWSAPLSS